MNITYSRFDVPVVGGTMAVGRWGTGSRIVLASHGITSNHMSFQRVGEQVVDKSGGEVSLVAVDHRGRGASADTPGPFGPAAHGDDLIAVLDHLGVTSARLVGHSMGAFVVAVAAERHGSRVDSLVLIDGGLPIAIELPPDADVESVVQSVIGPALDRLDQRWPDVEAYLDFFRAHPAFQAPNEFSACIEAYVRHDAVITEDGTVRSSANREAVLIDGGAAITDPNSSSAIERVTTPTTLLWAPRGLLDQTPGLFEPEQVAAADLAMHHVTTQLVADTNHYSVVGSEHGAAAVAEAIIS